MYLLLVTLVTLAFFPLSKGSTCVAGRYYPSANVSTYACIPCPAGKFGDVSGLDSESAACASLCPGGKYGTVSGSISEVSACGITCPQGKYGNIPGKATKAAACPNQCPDTEAEIPSNKIVGPPTNKLDACCPLTLTFEPDSCKRADKAVCTQLGLALFKRSHPNIDDKCGKFCKDVKNLKRLVEEIVAYNFADLLLILCCLIFVIQIEVVDKYCGMFWFLMFFLAGVMMEGWVIWQSQVAAATLQRVLDARCTFGGPGLRDQILIAKNDFGSVCFGLGIAEIILGCVEFIYGVSVYCWCPCCEQTPAYYEKKEKRKQEKYELQKSQEEAKCNKSMIFEVFLSALASALGIVDVIVSQSAQAGTVAFLETPFELSDQASNAGVVSDSIDRGEWCMKISNVTESCIPLLSPDEVTMPTIEIIGYVVGPVCFVIVICACWFGVCMRTKEANKNRPSDKTTRMEYCCNDVIREALCVFFVERCCPNSCIFGNNVG